MRTLNLSLIIVLLTAGLSYGQQQHKQPDPLVVIAQRLQQIEARATVLLPVVGKVDQIAANQQVLAQILQAIQKDLAKIKTLLEPLKPKTDATLQRTPAEVPK